MFIPKLSKNPVSSFVLVFLIFALSFTFLVHSLEARAGGVRQKYALVVGITEYQHEVLNNLNFPAKDAKAFYELLLDEKIGAFSKDKVTLLTDREATKEAFDSALAKLVTKAGENDLVVIYYSGHGAQGPDYNADEPDGRDEYYVTYDTDPTTGASLYRTGYRDDEFADRIKSISSNQVTI
ncbi:caspase family protein, partial [Candidatus Bipolaricaulota bacterium]|nr:caspase family protein [Candidatus Bipolaricaulota bacterium]